MVHFWSMLMEHVVIIRIHASSRATCLWTLSSVHRAIAFRGFQACMLL